jgi:copper chaperone CopZ
MNCTDQEWHVNEQQQDCDVQTFEKPLDCTGLETAHVACLKVRGLACPRCAQRVRNELLRLDGVLTADVFLAESMAAAAYDPVQLAPSALMKAVTAASIDGRHYYEAELMMVMPASVAFNL